MKSQYLQRLQLITKCWLRHSQTYSNAKIGDKPGDAGDKPGDRICDFLGSVMRIHLTYRKEKPYYEFYVGLLKDDKIEAIGPYFRQDGVYHLRPILERSRSFIGWNEFDSLPLPVEKMTDDQIPYFSAEGWDDSGERHSITDRPH